MWGKSSERSHTPTDDGYNKPPSFNKMPPHAQKYPNAQQKNPEDISFGGYTLDSFDPDLLAKQITLKVRVPYNVVGLVVGPKGSTIKRIQSGFAEMLDLGVKHSFWGFEIVFGSKKVILGHFWLKTGHFRPFSGQNRSF